MVLINGAGIAGLTLANALTKLNIPFCLVERREQWSDLGAGIALQNNGLAILNALNLQPETLGKACHSMELGILGASHIQRIDNEIAGLNCRVVHRNELQQRLHDRLPSSKFHFGCEIQDLKPSEDQSFNVTLSNDHILKADIIVNAAGIHSDLHAPVSLRDSGIWCWRTIAPISKPLTSFGEYWFGQQRLGIGAISENEAYVFHVMKTQTDKHIPNCSDQDRVDWITEATRDIPAFSNVDLKQVRWLSHPLKERKINWGKGRIVAIGDAAHAMTPNLGQGAVVSMEDAMELATLIANETQDLAGELKRIRHKRVKRIQQSSLLMGRFAHWHNPVWSVAKLLTTKALPQDQIVRKQVSWMNQYIKRLEEGFAS